MLVNFIKCYSQYNLELNKYSWIRKMFSGCKISSRNSKMFINFKILMNLKKFTDLKICLSINIVAPRQCVNKNPTVAHNRSTFWHVGPQMQKPPCIGSGLTCATTNAKSTLHSATIGTGKTQVAHLGECQMCACARVRSEGSDLVSRPWWLHVWT